MRLLRKNTAVIVTVGPFYDKTDGVTIETALTITNEKITLTADTDDGSAPTNILDNVTGATSGTANDLNYITGNDAGLMQLELAAADVNRLGRMFLSITDAANHVPVFHEFMVVNATLYDAFFATSGGAIPNVAAAAVGGLLTGPTTANTGLADVTRLLGTAWLTPGTAGTPDVNAKLWNALTTVELPLVPTTAGRKLDVSAGGEAGLDWANVGSPTTAVDLSGTTIKTTQKVDVETIKTNPVANAGTVTFPTNATLASTTNITAGTVAVATSISQIAGSATAATNLKSGALGLVPSTCAAGSTTTSIVTNLTEATDDHYNGRVITFTSGALLGETSGISDYTGATKTLTVVALTEAPADTDGFVIS